MSYLRLDRVGGRGRRRACVKPRRRGTPITHAIAPGLDTSPSAACLLGPLRLTLRALPILALSTADPSPLADWRAPRTVAIAAVTPTADQNPRPTGRTTESATRLDSAPCRSTGSLAQPAAPSPPDTPRLVAARPGGPALLRSSPDFEPPCYGSLCSPATIATSRATRRSTAFLGRR